jgi:hypothetical protein
LLFCKSGLWWIRIDLIQIRIQHFCSIRIQFRIRIQAKTELSKTISFSHFFETKIWVKSNQTYWCYSSNFFQKVVSAILYLFSRKFFFLNNQKLHFFHWNFLVFLPLDPDPQSCQCKYFHPYWCNICTGRILCE